MAQEHVRTELEQVKNARRESDTSRRQSTMEHAKLRKLLGQVLSELGVPIGPMLSDMLGRLCTECLPSSTRIIRGWTAWR
jgi:hypothetical protein